LILLPAIPTGTEIRSSRIGHGASLRDFGECRADLKWRDARENPPPRSRVECELAAALEIFLRDVCAAGTLISEPEPVVDGFGEVLFDAEIIHGGLNGFVAEQELDLFVSTPQCPFGKAA
jgi:hypothetical protein